MKINSFTLESNYRDVKLKLGIFENILTVIVSYVSSISDIKNLKKNMNITFYKL